MSSEDKYLIDTSPQRPNAEDYLFLRAAAIDQITQLGSNLWTDYNIHDPGITILELLCYALTDLGYRTSFPVADLLTRDGDGAPAKDSAFYTAKEILTSHPVTVEDYRKYIIDAVPGVRNIWFDLLDDQDYSPAVYIDEKKSQLSFKSPYFGAAKLRLRGLYNARIELEETELLNTRNFKPFLASIVKGLPNGANGNYSVTQINDAYRMHVRKKLLENRNLCEDFHDVVVVAGETVALCAEFLLYPTAIGSEPSDPSLDSMEHWRMVMRGHAAANMVPVVASNRIGSETTDGVVVSFYGSSFIATPTGALAADAPRDGEAVVLSSFDLDACRETRIQWGCFRDRRPDLYGGLLSLDGRSRGGRDV